MDTYCKPQHLAEFGKIAEGSPDLGKRFFEYYGAVFADGADFGVLMRKELGFPEAAIELALAAV